MKPYFMAKDEAILVAERQEDFHSPDQFYWYNNQETVFSITGKNSNNEDIIVMIRTEGGQSYVFPLEEMISERQAFQIMIDEMDPYQPLQARAGLNSDDEPIWEISFERENGRIGYYYISMRDGSWLRTIDNL